VHLAPQLLRIRQSLLSRPLAEPGAALSAALDALRPALAAAVRGRRLAIAVPSRGIDRMAQVLRELGRTLHDWGGVPALLPAMGSHGGGTPAGQVQQLRALGYSPEATGLPLLQPTDYRFVATYPDGGGLYLPAEVREASGLILINRIKLHTLFTGPVQSGLGKLLAFGLGGPLGAAASHRRAERIGLLPTLTEALQRLQVPARLLLGIALVEDQTHALAHLEVTPGTGILDADRRLLPLAAQFHPHLPLREGALLVVERMGKDLSGTGMDPHVIGRPPAGPDRADFHRIYVRALSRGSHGNALGIGYAEHVLASLLEGMDRDATELNAKTSGSLHKARIPPAHATDREALQAALDEADPGPLLQIADTLHVAEALCAGYKPHQLDGLEILERLGPLAFRPDGRLEHLLLDPP
jgi:hypothetical protein